jgi:hypothetical protein
MYYEISIMAGWTAHNVVLTFARVLTIYAYIDSHRSHPSISQLDVVTHFRTLKTGALVFTQSTLSRKLRERSKLEARVNNNPNALFGKRPRGVTSPEALVLWVRRMENKGETLTGAMPGEKHR